MIYKFYFQLQVYSSRLPLTEMALTYSSHRITVSDSFSKTEPGVDITEIRFPESARVSLPYEARHSIREIDCRADHLVAKGRSLPGKINLAAVRGPSANGHCGILEDKVLATT